MIILVKITGVKLTKKGYHLTCWHVFQRNMVFCTLL